LHELSDKEFDSLFRKAAVSVDYPFSEKAWQGFEKQLNRWELFLPLFWRIIGGTAILLLVTVSYLIFTGPEMDKQMSGTLPKGQVEIITTEEEGNLQSGPEKDRIIEEKSDNLEKTTKVNHESELEGIRLSGEKHGSVSHSLESHEFSVADKTESYEADNAEYQGSGFGRGRLYGLGLPGLAGVNTGDGPALTSVSGTDIVIPDKDSHRMGYSLNFTLGPDFSGVGANSYGTGTYLGFALEWYLFKRLSVFAGISHSRKKYAVYDEYTAPYPGIWTYGQVPDEVEIACHVLDIPVNLYYSIYENGKNRIFAGAGFSSYIMLTEEYHFDYYDNYDPDLIHDYNIKNENQHYFGIVNLSAGYTRYLNEKWALQIEPYYKLPIQDIAAAKVRLNSFGAFISLKYSIR